MKQQAIIIGAGPAGLTAAYELLTRSDIVPIVLEKSEYMGGLSRTVEYKGNRLDIGGPPLFFQERSCRELVATPHAPGAKRPRGQSRGRRWK